MSCRHRFFVKDLGRLLGSGASRCRVWRLHVVVAVLLSLHLNCCPVRRAASGAASGDEQSIMGKGRVGSQHSVEKVHAAAVASAGGKGLRVAQPVAVRSVGDPWLPRVGGRAGEEGSKEKDQSRTIS